MEIAKYALVRFMIAPRHLALVPIDRHDTNEYHSTSVKLFEAGEILVPAMQLSLDYSSSVQKPDKFAQEDTCAVGFSGICESPYGNHDAIMITLDVHHGDTINTLWVAHGLRPILAKIIGVKPDQVQFEIKEDPTTNPLDANELIHIRADAAVSH